MKAPNKTGGIRRSGRWVAALLLVITGATGSALDPPTGRAQATQPPNLLLVVVDDQARNSFAHPYMPLAIKNLARHGTRFANGLAAPPDCCPDRAGILTGQYPHNHGVFSNTPGYLALRDRGDTLPVWLRRAGYRTGMIGKFMNHYRGNHPAPGFDQWFAGSGTYFGYNVSDNGVVRHYGTRRQDYSTDVLTRHAQRFLRGSDPFFLWLGYNAPHIANRRFQHTNGRGGPCRGRMPQPPTTALERRFSKARLRQSAAFNERVVSDKPRRIRSLPPLNRAQHDLIRRRWRCTLATMSVVDRDLNRIVTKLRDSGQLSNTIIAYVSDNGYFFGEHRIPNGKGFPYEEALSVPFAIRVPRAISQSPPLVDEVVSNQDIAPTFLDYANAEPCSGADHCRSPDGHSLVPLLGGPGRWPSGRGALVELNTKARSDCACAYEAIRTRRYLYDELASGERELYDLRQDPGELQNVAGSPSYRLRQRSLAERLANLRDCSGSSCE
jgi:N-acetylglucosamine-6-sulfatase